MLCIFTSDVKRMASEENQQVFERQLKADNLQEGESSWLEISLSILIIL